jgi:hypothetical protein
MTNRSVPKIIILSLITFGIYSLFWLRATRREMVAQGQQVPSIWLIFAPLLLIIAVGFLQFGAHFALSSSVDASGNVATKLINILSLLAGVIAIIGVLPVTLWWMYKYCKSVEVVTGGKLTFGLSYGLFLGMAFLGFSFVWPGIIQDGFNRAAGSPIQLPPSPIS